MASISRRLLVYSGRCPPRLPVHPVKVRPTVQWQRSLSSTTQCYAEESNPLTGETISAKQPVANNGLNPRRKIEWYEKPDRPLSETEKQERQEAAMEDALKQLSEDLDYNDPDTTRDAMRKGLLGTTYGDEFAPIPENASEIEEPIGKIGFWGEGEEELGPDEDFYGDDLTSAGHGELERHRELREYARLAAWELPLLSQFARPFELPTKTTPFRFRYTSYLGESHPAANKVVVQFSPSDLSLTHLQKNKLIKLAGPRYNPSLDVVKLSCEIYDTLPQNKRFLGETIKELIEEAKDESDSFEDVPFDFRHYKRKIRHEFPKEWILTAERKKYLEEKRVKLLKAEEERTQNGSLVDGQKVIERSLPFTPSAPEAVPISAGGSRGKYLR